jgi:hypothetical protein
MVYKQLIILFLTLLTISSHANLVNCYTSSQLEDICEWGDGMLAALCNDIPKKDRVKCHDGEDVSDGVMSGLNGCPTAVWELLVEMGSGVKSVAKMAWSLRGKSLKEIMDLFIGGVTKAFSASQNSVKEATAYMADSIERERQIELSGGRADSGPFLHLTRVVSKVMTGNTKEFLYCRNSASKARNICAAVVSCAGGGIAAIGIKGMVMMGGKMVLKKSTQLMAYLQRHPKAAKRLARREKSNPRDAKKIVDDMESCLKKNR